MVARAGCGAWDLEKWLIVTMNSTILDQFTEELFRDAAFGLGALSVILLICSALFARIYLGFQRSCQKSNVKTQWQMTIRLMVAILLICFVQILSILMWTAAIYFKGLVTDLKTAMLFAGSCYTTLGIYSANLPEGWDSLAFYIAFSGLFSFAVATSAMLSMIVTIGRRFEHHAREDRPPI